MTLASAVSFPAVYGLALISLPFAARRLILCVAACLPQRPIRQRIHQPQPLTVVIAAQNDATTIVRCVESLASDPNLWIQIYVVTYNSTDNTAALATEAGACVVTLEDQAGHLEPDPLLNRGSALAAGIRRALRNETQGVLLVDPTSIASPKLVSAVAAALAGGADAVQTRCQPSTPLSLVSLPASLLAATQTLRLRALSRLGFSCVQVAGACSPDGLALSPRVLGLTPWISGNSSMYDRHLRQRGIRILFLDQVTLYRDFGRFRIDRRSLFVVSELLLLGTLFAPSVHWVRACGVVELGIVALSLLVVSALAARKNR